MALIGRVGSDADLDGDVEVRLGEARELAADDRSLGAERARRERQAGRVLAARQRGEAQDGHEHADEGPTLSSNARD